LHFGHRCLNKKVSLDLVKYFVEDIGNWLGKNQSTKLAREIILGFELQKDDLYVWGFIIFIVI